MLYQGIIGQYYAPQLNERKGCLSEFKSFYKKVSGNEGDKCLYNIRLDTYGCGCQHDCKYCYAKSLLSFRNLWNNKNPSVADINKIRRKIQKIPSGTVVRLGGMTDCMQPLEMKKRVTYETVKELNRNQIEYLIVTKSSLIANPEYLDILDRDFAHIQISVTTLNDERAGTYEKASIPSERIKAILRLQEKGFDVSIRLSPIIEGYMDFDKLNSLNIDKCIVEFLRVNSWIKKWFCELDFSNYTLYQNNYYHLELEDKIRILDKVDIKNKTVCEDVSSHYLFWQANVNPDKLDCCNLRRNN